MSVTAYVSIPRGVDGRFPLKSRGWSLGKSHLCLNPPKGRRPASTAEGSSFVEGTLVRSQSPEESTAGFHKARFSLRCYLPSEQRQRPNNPNLSMPSGRWERRRPAGFRRDSAGVKPRHVTVLRRSARADQRLTASGNHCRSAIAREPSTPTYRKSPIRSLSASATLPSSPIPATGQMFTSHRKPRDVRG